MTIHYRSEGGEIKNDRLAGKLAITRAFGDLALKKKGLSFLPEIFPFSISSSTQYLIIATDGLWDVVSSQVKKLFSISKL